MRKGAVDLHTARLAAAPLLVRLAGPGAVPGQHEAVAALEGDHGLVGDPGVHGLPVEGALGQSTLGRDTGGQLGLGPGPVRLAEDGALSYHAEARLAPVGQLTPVVRAGRLLAGVGDGLGRAALSRLAPQVRPKPDGRPVNEEAFGAVETLSSKWSDLPAPPPGLHLELKMEF